MRIEDLPNEILALIVRKTYQIDICNIKMINSRFRDIVNRYRLEMPIAKSLSIEHDYVKVGRSWLKVAIFTAIVPSVLDSKKVEVKKFQIFTEVNNPSNEITKALLELRIGGCEEFILDGRTLYFDLIHIFNSIGLNSRKLSAVKRSDSNQNSKIRTYICVPFITNDWLSNFGRHKSEQISLEGAKTEITMRGIMDFIKERVHVSDELLETHHFGTIEMVRTDFDIMHELCATLGVSSGLVRRMRVGKGYTLTYKRKQIKWFIYQNDYDAFTTWKTCKPCQDSYYVFS